MRLFFTFILLVIAALSAGATSLKLASGGKTNYVIVLPRNPSPAEELAGAELASYLEKITSARFPVQRTSNPPRRASTSISLRPPNNG